MTPFAKIARAALFSAAALAVAGCADEKQTPVDQAHSVNGATFYFGDNGLGFIDPLRMPDVSSDYGRRTHPVTGAYGSMHRGIDFRAPTGTPVVAVADGVVSFRGEKDGYGNIIQIDHEGDIETAYAHLDRFARIMREGQTVRQGQVIGYVGSTGRSTAPHLHFEIRLGRDKVDPMAVINQPRLRPNRRRPAQQPAFLADFDGARDWLQGVDLTELTERPARVSQADEAAAPAVQG